MNPKEIRLALEARQIELRPPATGGVLAEFERICKVTLCSNFREIYSEFNGYVSHDPKSYFTIWPLETIGKNIETSLHPNKPNDIAFGDFLFHSDIIATDISKNDAIVCLIFENKTLAPSLLEFFERVVSGHYDYFT